MKMTRITVETDEATRSITVSKAEHRCAVCGRRNTMLIELTNTDNGHSGWACWRSGHRDRLADMLRSAR